MRAPAAIAELPRPEQPWQRMHGSELGRSRLMFGLRDWPELVPLFSPDGVLRKFKQRHTGTD